MDPSQTRRVVLLVDLHPFLTLHDPARYSASVLASAGRLLSFPPLSSSLFACKPFFSSLSPLLSTSRVHRLLGKPAAFLSFDRPSETLASLSRTLASLAAPAAPPGGSPGRLGPSRASSTAELLFQLAYDCPWEPPAERPPGNDGIFSVRSNMVVLFSPLPHSSKCLSEFLDVGLDGEFSSKTDELCAKFVRIFSSAKDLYVARDVHLAWLDVGLASQESPHKQLIEKGIGGMGWGFCSTDAIALGSVLIPFGLIYPYIGCPMPSDSMGTLRKCRGELRLEISDVGGRPMECKCCDLEVLIMSLQRERADVMELFPRDSGSSIVARIQIKKVWGINEQPDVDSNMCASLLLRAVSGKCTRDQGSGDLEGFFPDKVLDLFSRDKGAVIAGKPAWQLLLSFLYRRSSCAFVSVSSSNGNSLPGVLRPFTVQSAVVYMMGCSTTDAGTPKLDEGSNLSSVVPFSEPTVSRDLVRRKKKNKQHLSMIHNLTCNSFREYVFNQNDCTHLDVGLEDLYFVKGCNDSKKLRFLQCWMRQIKKSNYSLVKATGLGEQSDAKEETEERSVSSQPETATPISSLPSAEEAHFCGLVNEETPMLTFLEDTEAFVENFSQKIDHVLNSEEVDLGNLVERLVNLAIQFFSVKFGVDRREDVVSEEGGNCDAMVAAEVAKLLLKKPKDIAAKYKSSNVPSSTSPNLTGANKVREHELQILFRMEILQSEVGSSIEENLMSKMVKDICLLLANIEFNLQGGMFAGESLIEFAGRIIKARYAHSLEDIFHRIYTEMEFFSFDGSDGEDSVSLPNSNNEPHRDEDNAIQEDAAGETAGNPSHHHTTLMDNSSHSQENNENTVGKGTESAESNVLLKAQERRERARRFSYFTGWRHNLQRVWAPKQAKVDKPILESFHRSSKKRRRHLSRKDMVCETPMMHTQDPTVQQDYGGEGRKARSGNASLSKALFHSEHCLEPV